MDLCINNKGMRLYFMGVGGTAMGNVALMLCEMGYDVYGADVGIYPPMSDRLKNSRITFYEGYDPGRLEQLAPDLVVVGNVVSRGHPEMEWLLETKRFRYTSLAALLSEFVLRERRNIVVAGTHGKTTTASLATCLLRDNRAAPGYLIGGVPRDLPSGACPGEPGGAFVIEGDEYDTAFFDKRSKFIHYQPHILLLNNLEFDHADIFRDLEDVKRTFCHVIRLVPRHGCIIANGDDPALETLLPVDWTSVYTVGIGDACDVRISDFQEDHSGAQFTLFWQGELWAHVSWSQHGLFNARNATMAALASGLMLYPKDPRQLKLDGLANFQGVKRRQELLYETPSTRVIEDFGHHPSALRETLVSLRRRYPGFRLIACFEPRSHTARMRTFQEDIVTALEKADTVMIGAIHRAHLLSAEERLDTQAICDGLKRVKPSIEAVAFENNEDLYQAILAKALPESESSQLFCFFSNGSFDGVMQRFIQTLKAEVGSEAH